MQSTAHPSIRWSFHPATEFEGLQDVWRILNQLRGNSPVLDPLFVAPLLREFGGGRELIAVGRERGDPRAIAMVRPASLGRWQTFQPSQAPLGLWISHPAESARSILPGLVRALPGYALVFGITQQDPEFFERPAGSDCLRTLDYIETAYINMPSTFDEFWSGRGRNLRRNLKRQRNRLLREGIEPRLEVLTDAAHVERAVADYGRLESIGWKSAHGTAVDPENAQGRFYTSILRDFCARGEGLIWRYWYANTLVATDLCLYRAGLLIVLKTTYDESQTSSSPAHLMRQEALANLSRERSLRRVEFYGRIMDWHAKWSDERRTLYHLNCYRWPVLASLRRTAGSRSGT